jgi:hypothetical protein
MKRIVTVLHISLRSGIHHFCWILFSRNKSLGPRYTWEEWVWADEHHWGPFTSYLLQLCSFFIFFFCICNSGPVIFFRKIIEYNNKNPKFGVWCFHKPSSPYNQSFSCWEREPVPLSFVEWTILLNQELVKKEEFTKEQFVPLAGSVI